jgi:TRAP-type mannitol/chloroaromatic compound transport system permease small subunit
MQIQQTVTQAWLHLTHVVPNTVFIFSIGYLMRQRQFFRRDVMDIHQQKTQLRHINSYLSM